MATKENPAPFDCYNKALSNEPLFTLLARDASAPEFVKAWAKQRAREIGQGLRPKEDIDQVLEALECADAMIAWRRDNNGAWRNTPLAIAAAG